MLRSEQLQDVLLDDIPTRDIPSSQIIQIGFAHLQQLLNLQDFAISLCKGAHFGTLEQYSHKFCQLAAARYDADSGLFKQTSSCGPRLAICTPKAGP